MQVPPTSEFGTWRRKANCVHHVPLVAERPDGRGGLISSSGFCNSLGLFYLKPLAKCGRRLPPAALRALPTHHSSQKSVALCMHNSY